MQPSGVAGTRRTPRPRMSMRCGARGKEGPVQGDKELRGARAS
jgi:hypothetical protein